MILTLVNNLIVVMLMHIYNCSFFKVKEIKKYKITIGWILVALVFTTQSFFDNAWFVYNMLTFLIPFACMSFYAYEGSIKRHLFFLCSYYVIAVLVDACLYVFLKEFFTQEQVKEIGANPSFNFIYNILFLLITRLISMFIKGKERYELSILDWLEVIFVPVSSLFLTIWCFGFKESQNATLDFVGLLIIMLINILSYFTYVKMEERAEYQYRAGILENRNTSYIDETKRITNLMEKIRRFEHDYNYLYEQIEKGNDSLSISRYSNAVAHSGNFIIDSIINNRAAIWESEGIDFRVDLQVPIDVKFCEDDISIILCNLIDNAVEAMGKCEITRWISIHIHTDKRNNSTLIIEIANPYNGITKKNYRGEYLTTKSDKANHGLGIQSVKNIVKKHNGETIINDDNNIFSIKIIAFDMLETTKST